MSSSDSSSSSSYNTDSSMSHNPYPSVPDNASTYPAPRNDPYGQQGSVIRPPDESNAPAPSGNSGGDGGGGGGGGSSTAGAVRSLLGGFGRLVNNARERTRAAVGGDAADTAPSPGSMEQGRAYGVPPAASAPPQPYHQPQQYQQPQPQYQQQQPQYQQPVQQQQHQPSLGTRAIGAAVAGAAFVGGAIASAAVRGGGGGGRGRTARSARPQPRYQQPLTTHFEEICCDDCIGTCCNDCCDCVEWFVRGIASFFAAILLLPFQIPIVVVGFVGAGIARAVPLIGTFYKATYDTGMIGPFLKGVLFVFIVPILAVGWALSIALSPFVVWFAQAAAIALGDENFLSVGVETVKQYWGYLSEGMPGELTGWGHSSRTPPFDLNPLTFLFLIVFSLVSSFAFVMPVTAVTAALAFLPSIARLVQASVAPRSGRPRDPLLSICAILFAPIGAIGLLLAGVLWPPFNCLFSVLEAWWEGKKSNALKFPAEAINVYWSFLREFFESGNLCA